MWVRVAQVFAAPRPSSLRPAVTVEQIVDIPFPQIMEVMVKVVLIFPQVRAESYGGTAADLLYRGTVQARPNGSALRIRGRR